jgi:hypothetical protein
MIVKPEEFLGFVDRDDEQSKQRLRSEPATESVWEEIIVKYPHLKRAVTLNKNLPEGILRLLAKDPDPLVRTDIAMKRTLPRDVFVLLAEDSDELVRARIAWNKKTPKNLLQKLAMDVSQVVAEPAKRQIAHK